MPGAAPAAAHAVWPRVQAASIAISQRCAVRWAAPWLAPRPRGAGCVGVAWLGCSPGAANGNAGERLMRATLGRRRRHQAGGLIIRPPSYDFHLLLSIIAPNGAGDTLSPALPTSPSAHSRANPGPRRPFAHRPSIRDTVSRECSPGCIVNPGLAMGTSDRPLTLLRARPRPSPHPPAASRQLMSCRDPDLFRLW